MAKVTFYDLRINEINTSNSPFTVRTRICLNIKDIPYETKWLTYFDVHKQIPAITKSDQRPTVPVIVDGIHGDKVVADSFDIARYLDEAFPDTPKLFDPAHEGLLRFFEKYVFWNVIVHMYKINILQIHASFPNQEIKDWYRENREGMFHLTLEQFAGNEADNVAIIKAQMTVLDDSLKHTPYITGQQVGYADVMMAAAFTIFKEAQPDLFESAILDALPGRQNIRQWWARLEPFTHSRN
ncbi:hypothetical protein BC940DRAFT_178924 [Gongronella butleri]|nr:hypothetical protein BC940DRAFT_178924 [Gongronella butleri]